ncbi:hypothetical protein J1N35_006746 [Gossypium stocksii]|uniref:Rx N-terminal domain-containing protein n=1 Tax=Gossypium stocksii TaxID=47602 RepID=A0A9D4AEU4_9ROSI|nr:hypothetical protein J1N35_006746 [Gossypium stocksii]
MAEFAVSLVVEKLTNLLAQQASYMDGVSRKIVQLRNELRWMQSFIKDADMKQEDNDLMQQWVNDVRDVAYETEEVIETYVSKAAARSTFDLVTKPFYLYKVGKEIESIRMRIREISGRRNAYGVERNSRGEGRDVERKRMKIGFIEKKLNVVYKNFKLLRVLDMEGVRVVSLPDTIGSLIQLRYLGLRKTNLEEELPLSMGNLQNLQTLDLRYSCFLKKIPNAIWKMVHLRHLLLYTPFDSPESGHLRMDTLCNLQSLPYIEAGNWINKGGLANMTSLRQLGIDGLSREQVTSVISKMERLQDIQSLSLMLTEQEMFPILTGLSYCEHLQKLCFYGRIEKLPDPQEFPPNLIKLTLYNSELQRDSIAKLERLPNLEMLTINQIDHRHVGNR